jgi:ubiquinone/menaquinone biosynthesis C-methylase UbiE
VRIVAQALVRPLCPPANAYDLAAPYYDEWKWQTFWRRVEWPTIVRRIDEWAAISGPPRLADLGCGTGWYLAKLESHCSSVVGLDISLAMLAQAGSRLPDVELLQGDVRDLPFGYESFDIVLSTRVLSHVDAIDIALSEIVRITRKGGLIILSDVDAQHDYRATRLPTGSGQVQVETFKHTRATIGALLQPQGTQLIGYELMSLEGETIPLADFASPSPVPVVGWISAWRRDE